MRRRPSRLDGLEMSLRSNLSRRRLLLARTWQHYRTEAGLQTSVPRGHFYSPLPDLEDGSRHAARESRREPIDGLPGVDLRLAAQHTLLLQMCDLYPEFDWLDHQTPARRFHLNQGYFAAADSICLYSMLRIFRPKRVIEVGSGFTSALMLDVNERFLDLQTRLTFIDPYPERLEAVLQPADRSHCRILREPVQTVAPTTFDDLESGDFLFIDSSHVSKTASDVNYLLFEVVPRLPTGVFVHVHDIFWPFEYPPEWIREGRAWNEAYLVRGFLAFNEHFEIVLWAPLAARQWPDLIQQRMPAYMRNTGASLWLRRVQ
jgi:predicted O-methyltransferase YrrM